MGYRDGWESRGYPLINTQDWYNVYLMGRADGKGDHKRKIEMDHPGMLYCDGSTLIREEYFGLYQALKGISP